MKTHFIIWTFIMSAAFSGIAAERAFEQQAQADLVIEFWHWESLHITKPADKDRSAQTKVELLKQLEQLKIERQLVVVILDKRTAPGGKDVAIDELVSFLHQLGFRRVVIQQAVSDPHPDGLPILKDSEKKEPIKPPEPTAHPR